MTFKVFKYFHKALYGLDLRKYDAVFPACVDCFLFVCFVSDGPVRLHREVVLLTDDRNLRVKALTWNVPVRDIPAFLSWAKVG